MITPRRMIALLSALPEDQKELPLVTRDSYDFLVEVSEPKLLYFHSDGSFSSKGSIEGTAPAVVL
jgi:hypothetical protein